MSNLTFANPQYLWGLLAIPVLVVIFWWALRRRQRALERFASTRLLPHLAMHTSNLRVTGKYLLLLCAAVMAIVACALPRLGFEERQIVSRGIDVMVAVDCSNSMLAQDYKPSRLARAKELLQNILWKAKGDRVGVIAFAGNAYVQCPLTLDYGMAKTALESLSIKSVPAQGTAIGTAIEAGIRTFEAAASGEKILVLLTDGEDQGSNPEEAAKKAAKAGIRIFTIGIGTSQGVAIPIRDGSGQETYKKDSEGKTVSTRLDFGTLEKIASLTKGQAIKANAGGSAELDVVISDIDRAQKTEQQERKFRIWNERFQWVLLPAIVLLVWEALETGYSRKRQVWKGRIART